MPGAVGGSHAHGASAPALSALQLAWLQELGLERRFLQPLARRQTATDGAGAQAQVPARSGDAGPAADGGHAALAHADQPAGKPPMPRGVGQPEPGLPAAALAPKAAGPGPSALAREMLSSLRAATGGETKRGRHGKSASPAAPAASDGAGAQPDTLRQANAEHASAAPQAGLDGLQTAVLACQACALHAGRAQPVLGDGLSQTPSWLVIGEAPGALDDRAGLPFQGKAGVLLRAMLSAVGGDLQSQVFYTNAVKCRPLSNRPPQPEEVAQCQAHLRRQIALLQPARILALGRVAASALLGQAAQWETLRGGARVYVCESGREIPVVVTYHPGWLLSHPQHKAMAWRDLLLARDLSR